MKFVYLVFILITYSIACIGAGSFIHKLLLKKENISPITYFSSSFLLGQGLLASVWVGLALADLFSLPIIIFVLLISITSFVFFMRRRIKSALDQMFSIWLDLQNESWLWKIQAGLSIVLCLMWITSLGRSVAGDGGAFYFSLPKVIAASHRLVPLPGYENFMYIGLQGEMHYAALMALGSAYAAQLFTWPTILAGTIILLAIGRKASLNRRSQWIVFSMMFTSSCVVWLSGDGKVDLFAASLGLASYFFALLSCDKEHYSASSLMTGLFAGFAITAKFSYIPVLLPGIAFLVISQHFSNFANRPSRNAEFRQLFRKAVIILVGFVIAMIPYVVKNGLLLNNPIAPFGQDSISQVWFNAETTKRIVLTYPLALTFGSYWSQYGTITPLLLAFLPLAILIPQKNTWLKKPLILVSISALLGMIIWVVIQPSVIAPRYFLSTILLLMLLPAKALETLSRIELKPRICTNISIVAIYLVLLLTGAFFYQKVFFPQKTLAFITGDLGECDRVGEKCLAMEAINSDASLGDRVFLASYQRYWLRPDLIQCASSSSTEVVDLTSENYWDSLYQSGFKYLLVDHTTHSIPNLFDHPGWIELVPLFEGNEISAYRIDSNNSPLDSHLTCVPQASNGWAVISNQ